MRRLVNFVVSLVANLVDSEPDKNRDKDHDKGEVLFLIHPARRGERNPLI